MARRPIEVERKWLIEDLPELSKNKGARITQGYMVVSPEGTEVRLRRKEEQFF